MDMLTSDEVESLAQDWSTRLNMPYDMTQTKAVDRRLAFKYMTPSSTVLDVGGASGEDSGLFAMVGANVTLLDIEERYLKRGRRLVREFGLDHRFAFVLASATALPFRNQAFDIVTCFSVLDHLPDKQSVQTAVREFAKVVCEKGYVAITFPNKSFLVATALSKLRMALNKSGDRSRGYWEQRFTVKEFTRYVARSGMRVRAYDYGTPKYVGEGIMAHNLPFEVRVVRPALLAFFSVFLSSTNFLLRRRGMHLFGPRFGILCEAVQMERQGRNL